ncbi:glycerophosphodiester phosphodiesterase family protein [Bacillus sp. FSL W7-1360]
MTTMIYAHRGASGTYPENTMSAFQAAVLAKADGIEFDIQLTKDGVPVVIHDETIDRTTDGRGAISDYTAAELARFNAAARYPQLARERIPTFVEVLAWAATYPSLLLNIELKAYGEDRSRVVAAVSQVLQETKGSNEIVVSSFDHIVLAHMKEAHPELEIAVLTMGPLFQPEKYIENLGATGYHLWSPFVTEPVTQDVQSAGVALRSFTVNDERQLRDFLSWGCTIFTDFPERAVKIRSELRLS